MERFCTMMVCAVILAIALLTSPKSNALEQTWINHADLRFSMVGELAGGETRPTTVSGSGNRDCYLRDVVTRPSEKFSYPPSFSELRSTMCGVDAQYGFVSNIFMRTGTNVGGQFVHGNLGLVGGANLSSGVLINPSDGKISIVPGITTQLRSTKNFLGEVEYRLLDTAQVLPAKTASGAAISVAFDTIAFSSNGKWMLADAPGYGLVRVNTETAEVLSFGTPTTYFNGTSPGYQTAISADGRYVAVASGFYQTFQIYDLESCSGQQFAYPNLKSCAMRNLQETFLQKVSYGVTPIQIRFVSKNELTFYAGARKNGLFQWRQYRMTMGDVPQFGFEYLGLGDSFASGEGAGQYKTITDASDNMCHTSTISYPFLSGLHAGKEKFDSIACSGAVIDDVFQFDPKKYPGQAKDGKTQEQRNLDVIVQSILPGKVTQESFLGILKPEAISISIGGNDIGFGDKIKSCISGALPDTTCFNTYEERLEAVKEIETQIPRLVQTYKALASNKRKVYVLGYPKLIDPDGNCANNVHLDASEADFADKLVVVLNNAIETATKRAGVVYVDTENMLVGHRLCEADTSEVYVHGITAGDERGIGPFKFMSAASFHPKAEAHPLYRDALLSQTSNLTKVMPKPDPGATFSVPAAGDSYWQAQKNGRSTFIPKLTQSLPNISRGQPTQITVDDAEGWLKPDSDVMIELHSNPIKLGTFRTDANGKLTAVIMVPLGVSAGFHSIHMYGQNVAGEPVDLYQYLYVLAGADDADGDGILDKDDPCTFIDPIGEDKDKDGIDDGCDTDPNTPEKIATPVDSPIVPLKPDTDIPEVIVDTNPVPEVTPEQPDLQPAEPTDEAIPSEEDLNFKNGLNESVAGNETLISQPGENLQNAVAPALNNTANLSLVGIQSIVTEFVSEAVVPQALGVAVATIGATSPVAVVSEIGPNAVRPKSHFLTYALVATGVITLVPATVYVRARIL